MLKKLLGNLEKYDSEKDPDPRSKKLYGLAGLYNTPNEIIEAAATVAGKGYEKFDVYTPYPLHGMDDAMGLGKPKVGPFAFMFGISGTFLALLMIGWMMGIDYPNIIGGKPFFALPSSIPITFRDADIIQQASEDQQSAE